MCSPESEPLPGFILLNKSGLAVASYSVAFLQLHHAPKQTPEIRKLCRSPAHLKSVNVDSQHGLSVTAGCAIGMSVYFRQYLVLSQLWSVQRGRGCVCGCERAVNTGLYFELIPPEIRKQEGTVPQSALQAGTRKTPLLHSGL